MDVRIVELPSCRMASSGPSPDAQPFAEGGLLSRFSDWFTQQHDPLRLAPRDLMWFDQDAKALVWGYLLAPGQSGGPWPVLPFDGGLYASAVSRDEDDADGERVLDQVRAWVADSPFEAAESVERPVVFRVATTPGAAEVLGYHQLEIMLPVRARAR